MMESRTRRLLELRLVTLFVTEISSTLPGAYIPENLQRWMVDVPQMALEHEPLLHALLSLSILYIIVTGKVVSLSSEDLLTYRTSYLEMMLTQHRQFLDTLNAENAECISYTSILLSTDALACLRDRVLQPYEPPCSWLHMSQGTKSVVGTALGLASGNPLSKLYSQHQSAFSIWDPAVLRSEANMQHFPHLLNLFNATDNEKDLEAYTDALCFIAAADVARMAGEHPNVLARRVVMFPCYVMPRFVQLVTMREPRSLAILAHLFGLAMCVGDCWFIGDAAWREIMAIEAFIGPEWQDRMSWPLKMARLKLDTFPLSRAGDG